MLHTLPLTDAEAYRELRTMLDSEDVVESSVPEPPEAPELPALPSKPPEGAPKLSKPEKKFVESLVDPLSVQSGTLDRLGAKCGLTSNDVAYIYEWVICKGIHWLSGERAKLSEIEAASALRNPVVQRVIDYAASLGFCTSTSATKGELLFILTQWARNPHLSNELRDKAIDRIAKLEGFYPDTKNGSSGSGQVIINIANPYGSAPEVKINASE